MGRPERRNAGRPRKAQLRAGPRPVAGPQRRLAGRWRRASAIRNQIGRQAPAAAVTRGKTYSAALRVTVTCSLRQPILTTLFMHAPCDPSKLTADLEVALPALTVAGH